MDIRIVQFRSIVQDANGETPGQITSTIKKALEMSAPVIIGVPVDYRDNHKLM